MHGLYELKEMLCKELEKYGEKGELTAGSLEIIDKLAHSIKNLDKIIKTDSYSEAGESSYRYSREGGMSNRGGSYEGGSYARGRGRNARRDSMGRYSRERGYSRDEGDEGKEDMIMQLRELMEQAPSQKIQQRIQDLMSELENA